MTLHSTGARHANVIHAVDLFPIQGTAIAAFAIDAPRAGDRLPGRGLEVNGWVIGRGDSVVGVRMVSPRATSPIHPLEVRRPDVAADYPDLPGAGSSGFSFWSPLDSGAEEDAWGFMIEAVLDNGGTVPLAAVQGTTLTEPPPSRPGHRPVFGPDFVIIGAQRGGTTSLHAYLSAHPQVVTPATKELHFLTDRYERGPEWYAGQFPASLPTATLTGEATPYALFHPRSPCRLREAAPAARIIVLLRNPIDRAYSHYRLELARGHEQLSFEEALAAEQTRLAGEEECLLADDAYVSPAHNHSSYLSRGDYAPQLERWFNAFPREQFLILRSEDLYGRPAETFDRVTTFLGLPSIKAGSFPTHNRTEGPPLQAAMREQLAKHFAPRNERLADLLAWDRAWT